MKLPQINLNFLKSSTKKTRSANTSGKRSSFASASTVAASRKAHRSLSSKVKTRKRSITYYAPSKSKLYSSDHFPTMHRSNRHTTSTIPITSSERRSYLYDRNPINSTQVNPKSYNNIELSTVKETFNSYVAKQTYLCDKDYGDIVLHQPPACYRLPQSPALQPDLTRYKVDQNVFTTKTGDTYPKDFALHGVPISSLNTIMVPTTISESNNKYHVVKTDSDICAENALYNFFPTNIDTTFALNQSSFTSMDNPNIKYSKSNCYPNNNNNNQFHAMSQSKPSKSIPAIAHGIGLPIYKGAKIPLKKKSDRQRKRKVRQLKKKEIVCACFSFMCMSLGWISDYNTIIRPYSCPHLVEQYTQFTRE